MTNKEVLELRIYGQAVEEQFFARETKFVIPQKLLYATQKFMRQSKSILEEQQEIFKVFQKVFKEKVGMDEELMSKDKDYEAEINEKYKEFLKEDANKETLDAFNDAECGVEFYKIDKAVLEEAILPNEFIENLEKLV